MAKAEATSGQESGMSTELKTPEHRSLEHRNMEDSEQHVRALVLEASSILRRLGPDRSRIGWMLDDALMYLDEISVSEKEGAVMPAMHKTVESAGALDSETLEQLVQSTNS